MALTPWLNRDKQRQNKRSQRLEREHAKETKGRVQPGSGSSWRAPEDVRGPIGEHGDGFLDQHKFSDGVGFRITVAEWKRLRKHALQQGRSPRFIIEFPQHGIKLYVCDESGLTSGGE